DQLLQRQLDRQPLHLPLPVDGQRVIHIEADHRNLLHLEVAVGKHALVARNIHLASGAENVGESGHGHVEHMLQLDGDMPEPKSPRVSKQQVSMPPEVFQSLSGVSMSQLGIVPPMPGHPDRKAFHAAAPDAAAAYWQSSPEAGLTQAE